MNDERKLPEFEWFK